MSHHSPPTRRWPALIALIAVVLSGLALAPSASATPIAVTDASFTWAVSTNINTGGSLTPSRAAHEPATVAPAGWTFTGGTGTYDPSTGALDVSFEGGLEFGNVARGNYGFLWSNPRLVIDADGDGSLSFDVANRLFNGVDSPWGATQPDVVVANFVASTGAADGGTVAWTVTPLTDDVVGEPAFDGAQQFATSFMSTLDSSLLGHFMQTNAAGPENAANIGKLPAPITFSVAGDFDPAPVVPAITVTPSTDIVSGSTVTIEGSGFAGVGVYVRLCAAVDGELGTPAGRPGADRCLGDPQHWVSAAGPGPSAPMSPEGTFTASLALPSSFTAGGETIDCTAVTCGIAVRRDHIGGATDFSYDLFTPVTFAASTDPGPGPGPGPDPDPGPGAGPTAGTLDWGVKSAFRNYILHGPAAGTITTDGGATTLSDGTFRFPVSTGGHYTSASDLVAPFGGSVTFEGHGGLLQVHITDPVVQIDGTDGVLIADVESRSLATGLTETWDDVEFADLDVASVQPTASGKVVTFAKVPASLTEDGAEAFAGFYTAGTELDPVTVAIEVADPGDLPGAGAPDPGADVVGCVPSSLVAGASFSVCGGGFIPGEQVQVILHSDPIVLGVLTAGADGSVNGQVTLPTSAPVGTHTVELHGVTSGRSIYSAQVTVVAQAPAPAQAGALPNTGSDASDLAVLGAALIGAGLVLTAASRRRRRPVGLTA